MRTFLAVCRVCFLALFGATSFCVSAIAQQTPPAPPPPAPPSARANVGVERLLAGLQTCKADGVLEPHCEATIALLNFFERFGSVGGRGASPACDRAVIAQVTDLNWKVNTAIEMHKASDQILDKNTDVRKISIGEKSRHTTNNDVAINRILFLLTTPYGGQPSYAYLALNVDRSEYVPSRDLMRHAEEVLYENFQLAKWGPDAGFLAAARAIAVYQLVLNCTRALDGRFGHLGPLMNAKAHAVRLAAESESFFSKEAEILRRGRQARPALRRWTVERALIDGVLAGGFPRQIYLGSNHGFEFWQTRPRTRDLCGRGEVRNFYGTLTGNFTDKFKSGGLNPPDGECAAEVNSRRLPSINSLLTNRFRSLTPAGGLLVEDFEVMLKEIEEALNAHIQTVTNQKDLEDCFQSGDLTKCPPLPPQTRPIAEQNQDIVQERARAIEEFTLLQRMSYAIRDALSPSFEFNPEWRRQ